MFLSVRNYLRGPYTLYHKGKGNDKYEEAPVPLEHKWLPGDAIDPETGRVTTRNAAPIVGIVDYLSRTGQGFTGRGIPLYMFYPLSESYPPMIVSSKQNPKENKIVVVNYEHWESKWPRAGIQRVLGSVGDISVEKTALLMRSSTHSKVSVSDIQYTASSASSASSASHTSCAWDKVFNIDPDGCLDVDDVLCWRRIENGYEFGIAIADVAAWIAEGSDLDIAAYLAAQTLYIDGFSAKPMLPTSLSESASSLRSDGLTRPALALIYTIPDEKTDEIHSRWERILISTHKTYTYDTVYEDVDLCAKLTGFLTSICCYQDVTTDSHRWIELAMLTYNRAAARVLRDAGAGILRSHSGTPQAEWSLLAEQTGCADLAWFGYASGKYVRTPATNEDAGPVGSVFHAGLGLDCYCHASSPLRRYADLTNQRWLKHILFDEEAPRLSVSPAYLSERGRVAKQLDRDIWFLSNLRPDRITTTEGILISEGQEGRWKVYVPEWRRKITGKFNTSPDAIIGRRVVVRAYTNLKSAQYENRLVCSLELIPT